MPVLRQRLHLGIDRWHVGKSIPDACNISQVIFFECFPPHSQSFIHISKVGQLPLEG